MKVRLTQKQRDLAIAEYRSELARRAGSVSSPAKVRAARANAKLGGWPKGKSRKFKVESREPGKKAA